MDAIIFSLVVSGLFACNFKTIKRKITAWQFRSFVYHELVNLDKGFIDKRKDRLAEIRAISQKLDGSIAKDYFYHDFCDEAAKLNAELQILENPQAVLFRDDNLFAAACLLGIIEESEYRSLLG